MAKFLPLETHLHKVSDWRLTLCCLSPLSLELISTFLDHYHVAITNYSTKPAERTTLICTRLSYFCVARSIRYQQVFDVLDTIFGENWCQLNECCSPQHFLHDLGFYDLASKYDPDVNVDWHFFTPEEGEAICAKIKQHFVLASQTSQELYQSVLGKLKADARVQLVKLVSQPMPRVIAPRTEDVTDEHLQLVAKPDTPLEYLWPWRETDLQFILAVENDMRQLQLIGLEQKVVTTRDGLVPDSIRVEYDKKAEIGHEYVHWDYFFHVLYANHVCTMEGTVKHVFQTSMVRNVL